MVTTTRLRMFRRAHGITLDELAKRAGFSNQWLSFLELGKRERTASQEEKLSRAIEALLAERHTARPCRYLTDDAVPRRPRYSTSAAARQAEPPGWSRRNT